jgi:hypothetical protein
MGVFVSRETLPPTMTRSKAACGVRINRAPTTPLSAACEHVHEENYDLGLPAERHSR